MLSFNLLNHIIFITTAVFVYLFPFTSAASQIVGKEEQYIVQKGDTLDFIASKLGLKALKIRNDNKLAKDAKLKPGMILKVDTRRILPKSINNGIIINIPERMLYYFKDGKVSMVFPVGLGKIFRGGSDNNWHTPIGQFSIKAKQKDPVWYVPVSIQREMEKEGKPVEVIVSPGPDNPLGRFVLRTDIHNIHIHETIYPTSVHKFSSHGCIRVLPQHMEVFFKEVEIGTVGEIIYKPIKALYENGRVYIEVHKDYYRQIGDLQEEAKRLLAQTGNISRVDWKKVEKALLDVDGSVVDVTLN
ncbi:MAG: L,D-transpeptidase family protein [Thermodesulfovibrionales bacterium]|nr:L,D-transpeptidase family protein [Thermodesulfovibrionales bacterium]